MINPHAPLNILVVTPVYGLAGVPLAQIRFARALQSRGHNVQLLIGSINEGTQTYLPADLNILVLGKKRVRSMLAPLLNILLRNKIDIIFSAEDHLTVIVLIASLLSLSNALVSGSSRVLPSDRLAYSRRLFSKGWLFKQLTSLLMPRASVLSCVSQDMVSHYKKYFPNGKHCCIYNIIKDNKSLVRSTQSVDHPWLLDYSIPVVIGAGTLTKRKGFGDLINAFAIASSQRSMRLILLGDGYLRPALERQVRDLNLTSVVDMPGNVSNPLAFFSRCQVFVLSSYAEGLPNVLVEAMMCGCTPVSTDCPTGPREVLADGKFGYLVPMRDPTAMSIAILQALERPIPKSALDLAVTPFEESVVVAKHFTSLGLTSS